MAANQLVPLSAPMAGVEPGIDLDPTQWRVLLALCDAAIPGIRRGPSTSPADRGMLKMPEDQFDDLYRELRARGNPNVPEQVILDFLTERPSSIPAFKDIMRSLIFKSLPIGDRVQLGRVLTILGTSVGSLLFTSSTTPVMDQSLAAREKLLQSWAASNLGALRMLKAQVTLLAKQVWARSSPTLEMVLGFPRVRVDCPTPAGYEYNFIQLPPSDTPEVIETDVLVVGSGCGGGVAARNLAEAGLNVLVVDKAYHWSPQYLPMTSEHGPAHLYANGGSIMSDDGSTCVIAGQIWGGGGTVNWSASLQPQGFVRREWASDKLPLFTSVDFQESLDRVCDAMGVTSENITHSIPNQTLMEGSRKLGWAHKVVPQNTNHAGHTCGALCGMGCRASAKQGPAVAWLPPAAKAGAKFMEGFEVDKIIFEKRGSNTVATGAVGTWKSRDDMGGVAGKPTSTRKVIIKATKVIVSGGSMMSPLLLIRSGLRNKHIGKNLHVHPVTFLGATYDEPIVPWDGSILSSVCTEFENLDGQGHGTKLETTCMTPFAWMSWLCWTSCLNYKRLAGTTRHTGGFISIARDKDTGSVTPDPVDGRVRLQYHPSKLDKNHIMEGLIALARVNRVSGAQRLFTTVPNGPIWTRGEAAEGKSEDDTFEEFLAKLRSGGFPSEHLFVSAHQMGTCRMASSPKNGVVDGDGQVFGVKGLHVMDASVFPSASGVNPFITTMAISDTLSRRIAENWTRGKL